MTYNSCSPKPESDSAHADGERGARSAGDRNCAWPHASNVRFRFVPQDGEQQLSDDELKSMPRDFLEQALIERPQQRSAHWDIILTIGEPGDPEITRSTKDQ
jgi:hypothetical protein